MKFKGDILKAIIICKDGTKWNVIDYSCNSRGIHLPNYHYKLNCECLMNTWFLKGSESVQGEVVIERVFKVISPMKGFCVMDDDIEYIQFENYKIKNINKKWCTL